MLGEFKITGDASPREARTFATNTSFVLEFCCEWRVETVAGLRSVVSLLLWRLGISGLARSLLASNGRFVLEFHGVSKCKHPNIPVDIQPYLAVDDLRQVLDWLRNHFTFLTPEEFLQTQKRGVLLTFDDGLANNYTNVLPILTDYNVPSIFFISTQHVISPRNWLSSTCAIARKYWGKEEEVPDEIAVDFYDGMSQEQLMICSRNPLITIGSHTVSHPFLPECGRSQLEFELTESRCFLQEVTGQCVDLFAYPAGSYNLTIAEAVRTSGYRAAFAEDGQKLGLPSYEIPRIGIYAAKPAYLSLKLSGLHRRAMKGKTIRFNHFS